MFLFKWVPVSKMLGGGGNPAMHYDMGDVKIPPSPFTPTEIGISSDLVSHKLLCRVLLPMLSLDMRLL